MGEQIKIADLAKEMIFLHGLKPDVDIKIEYIGLRPGEKLYEEILLNTERDKATKADKIFIAQLDSFDSRVLRRKVKELEKLASVMNGALIVEKLKEIVSL